MKRKRAKPRAGLSKEATSLARRLLFAFFNGASITTCSTRLYVSTSLVEELIRAYGIGLADGKRGRR